MTMSIDIFNYIFKLAPLVHKPTTTPPPPGPSKAVSGLRVVVLEVEYFHIFNYIFIKDGKICAPSHHEVVPKQCQDSSRVETQVLGRQLAMSNSEQHLTLGWVSLGVVGLG